MSNENRVLARLILSRLIEKALGDEDYLRQVLKDMKQELGDRHIGIMRTTEDK